MTDKKRSTRRESDESPTAKRHLHAADSSDLDASIAREGTNLTKFSDAVASERLAKALGKSFRFCPALGWMHWDGKVWAESSEPALLEATRRLHKKWYMAAIGRAALTDAKQVGQIKRLLSTAGMRSVVTLCQGLLLVDLAQFNQHRDLLNTQSGVVDLRTGVLIDHDPQLYFTKITAVDYRPKARHDDWDAVLGALRKDARDYMRVRIGQALTGYMPEDDVICFLRGGGENGKTTFIGGVTRAMGTYYRQVSDKVLLADPRSHSTELTDLFGLRLAVVEELPEGNHVDAVLLKKITSPEITARRIQRDTMTFAASHSMIVTSNYTTHVAETDHGTWRRLQRIAFPYTYVKPGRKRRAGEREGDPTLRDRVRSDPAVQEAALRWMVAGAVDWYANGKKMPPAPVSVERDTREWRMKSDLVLGYWDEFLEQADAHYIPSASLHEHFNLWLKANGHAKWSLQTFSERFGSHDMSKGVVGPKQVKASKSTTRSMPPEGIGSVGGDGEATAQPFRAGKAWVGVRFRAVD